MAKKKEKTKKDKDEVKYEQSMWSVRINSQTLYKKPIDGRTNLLGMNPDEKEEVAEVLDKTFDELSKILEKRTTMHEAPQPKGQVTRVDTATIQADSEQPEVTEAEQTRSEDAKKTATNESKGTKEEKPKKDDNGEGSLLGKLSS